MFPNLSITARAVTYYLMALGMCVALALTWPSGEAAAVLAMLTPVLSVLIMQLVVTRDGWRRSGWASLGLGVAGAGPARHQSLGRRHRHAPGDPVRL